MGVAIDQNINLFNYIHVDLLNLIRCPNFTPVAAIFKLARPTKPCGLSTNRIVDNWESYLYETRIGIKVTLLRKSARVAKRKQLLNSLNPLLFGTMAFLEFRNYRDKNY